MTLPLPIVNVRLEPTLGTIWVRLLRADEIADARVVDELVVRAVLIADLALLSRVLASALRLAEIESTSIASWTSSFASRRFSRWAASWLLANRFTSLVAASRRLNACEQ